MRIMTESEMSDEVLEKLCKRIVLRAFARGWWSVLVVVFLFVSVSALIFTGFDRVWGWLLIYPCWWCLKKFAEPL